MRCPQAAFIEMQAGDAGPAPHNVDGAGPAGGPTAGAPKTWRIAETDGVYNVFHESEGDERRIGILHPWWGGKAVRCFTAKPTWKVQCCLHSSCSTLLPERDRSVAELVELGASWLEAGVAVPANTRGANANHRALKPKW